MQSLWDLGNNAEVNVEREEHDGRTTDNDSEEPEHRAKGEEMNATSLLLGCLVLHGEDGRPLLCHSLCATFP